MREQKFIAHILDVSSVADVCRRKMFAREIMVYARHCGIIMPAASDACFPAADTCIDDFSRFKCCSRGTVACSPTHSWAVRARQICSRRCRFIVGSEFNEAIHDLVKCTSRALLDLRVRSAKGQRNRTHSLTANQS